MTTSLSLLSAPVPVWRPAVEAVAVGTVGLLVVWGFALLVAFALAVLVFFRGFLSVVFVWLLSVLARTWVLARSPFWVLFAVFWPASAVSKAEVAPGVPLGTETDGFGQPTGLLGEGGATEFRSVPLGIHLYSRPRRRAVWVRRLQSVLGVAPGVVGQLVRGRWLPDLPSPEFSLGTNLTLAHLEEGVRILGGGSVQTKPRGSDEPGCEAYLVVELSDGSREVVFPSLLATLSSYSLLRQRDATLVGALRLRAVEWCRGVGLSKAATWAAVPSAFRFAWQVSPAECRLRDSLAGGPSSPLWWSSA